MLITKEIMSENLQFMSLFISLFESLSDYIVSCPKQLLNGDTMISESSFKLISEQDDQYKQEQNDTKIYIKTADLTRFSQHDIDRLHATAEYGYTKYIEDGFVKWNSPMYIKLIHKRELNIRNKTVKNILLNSLMFFVDHNAITQDDFLDFLTIRDLRNKFAHEMPQFIIAQIAAEYTVLFDKLVQLYIRINNFWSVNFELSIGGEDIPTDVEIDYDNVITNELYNLFLAIDVLKDTKYVVDKEYRLFIGLYEALQLPIIASLRKDI